MDSLVQSKKPMSWSLGGVRSLRKGSTSPALWARKTHSFVKEGEVSRGTIIGEVLGITSSLSLLALKTTVSARFKAAVDEGFGSSRFDDTLK
jgi:hypothetical protein